MIYHYLATDFGYIISIHFKFCLYSPKTPQIWSVLPKNSPNLVRTPRVLPKYGLYSPNSPNELPGENPSLVTMSNVQYFFGNNFPKKTLYGKPGENWLATFLLKDTQSGI